MTRPSDSGQKKENLPNSGLCCLGCAQHKSESRTGRNSIPNPYIHKPQSFPGNEVHTILLDFQAQTDHPISARRPDLLLIEKTERTCYLENFAVSSDRGAKIKESENIDKYLNLARELKKKPWNMKLMVIPIVVGLHGTNLKGMKGVII